MSSPEPALAIEKDPPRRPYEPPAIEETSEFETLALNCGLAVEACYYYGNGTITSS